MKLHFREYGTGSSAIILHGLFGSLDNWHSISVKLSPMFRVYAVDLRNHGKSPHNPEMSYSLMADDMKEFVSSAGLERVSLLGHSIGGKVVMQFSLTYPNLVEKLVVADIAPRAYRPHHEYIFRALLSLDLAAYTARKQIEAALAPEIPDLALRQFLLKNVTRNANGAFEWQLNLPALHENYAKLLAALSVDRTCDRPALFVRGEKSDYIQSQDEPLIYRLFPQAKIRTLANAGHWLHADVPETFVRIVQEFLRE